MGQLADILTAMGFDPARASALESGVAGGSNARADYDQSRWNDQLAESRADRQLRLKQMNGQLQAEKARIAIAKGQAEADKWYKEQQIALAREELGFNREKFGVETGLNLLQLGASLRGPGNWSQFLDMAEGARAMLPQSPFLQALAGGGTAQALGAMGGTPTANTVQNLAGFLTGGAANGLGITAQGTPAAADPAGGSVPLAQRIAADKALSRDIMSRPNQLAPQALEGLGRDRLDYLTGLIEAQGGSAQTLLDQYATSRWGQASNPNAL